MHNYIQTSSQIDASVEKELWTDSSGWTTLKPGQHDRWGRKAGTYEIFFVVNGRSSKWSLNKPGSEVLIVVNSADQIVAHGANSWRRK